MVGHWIILVFFEENCFVLERLELTCRDRKLQEEEILSTIIYIYIIQYWDFFLLVKVLKLCIYLQREAYDKVHHQYKYNM